MDHSKVAAKTINSKFKDLNAHISMLTRPYFFINVHLAKLLIARIIVLCHSMFPQYSLGNAVICSNENLYIKFFRRFLY